ncbi:MAG: efflux RND transporter permease subunit [Flavobacteriaceae bacterium]|nr:efflux RND transporter permease subunit [Flavobacteriaceae bacterium]
MVIKNNWNFWEVIARLILRNRVLILTGIVLVTFFWVSQWQYIRFTFSEANLLPDKHIDNIKYDGFIKQFGDEGNVLLIAVKDSTIFNQKKFEAWNILNTRLSELKEIDFTIGTSNIKTLIKNTKNEKFEVKSVLKIDEINKVDISDFKETLFLELPFYKNLIYSESTKTLRSIAYMDPNLVNTKQRKIFIIDVFLPLIESFEKENNVDLKVSGMPYVRTLNAQNIVDEISVFVLSAMALTSLIFFLFFRSIRATLISLLVVLIGVMWSFGILGFLGYEITVITALIPPLIIVIGVPNCIFLINKYQQEVSKHGNQIKSLQRVIVKIGNATLMTNLTTACGFATFILTNSKILKEFGIVASINIFGIFLLSLFLIPIIYSFLPIPSSKHLKHLKNKSIDNFVQWMENNVKYNRINVYIISLLGLIFGIIGIYQIEISGSLIEDMPKKSNFFKDIKFYDEEFSGVVPIEVLIDTKRKNGVYSLATLRRIDEFQNTIEEYSELAPPISIVNAFKFAKQAYYNGNPNYYKLPTSQENKFISKYINNANNDVELLSNYIDSTGQYGRITTFMRDISTNRIEEIEKNLKSSLKKIFPSERFNVLLTGKSLLFLKGTKYLVKNLFLSLSLAILLIALFMAYMFRSFKMIIISLIPNLLPLIITAGVMGFSGIPLKASTILVFSIAFGISVDDTIHFLAKYRQELSANNWKIKSAIYSSLRETGISMFYTSIVLFFGFAVFMTSDFGGTVALGGLVSVTLLLAMLANLILLPSLLISMEDKVSNKKTLKKPKIKIIEEDQE